jgi:endoglucanase
LSISISGNNFVDGSGRRVVLRGVNTEGTQYDCAQSATRFTDDPTVTPGHYDNEIAAMRTWGMNLVRVNLNEQCWLGINGVPIATSSSRYRVPPGDSVDRTVNAYMNDVGTYVAALHNAGMYVELDLHLNAPGTELITDAGVSAQNPMPDANSEEFWKSVAGYFHDDHAVLFGLFNEPFPPDARNSAARGGDWSCVIDGCTVPDYTSEPVGQYARRVPSTNYQGVGMRRLIADVRSVNPTAPILAGGPDFAGLLNVWTASYQPGGLSLDPDKQLAASVHVYYPAGNTPCSDATTVLTACGGDMLSVAKTVPVIVDEFGEYGCGNTSAFALLRSIDAANASGSVDIGYAGWSWTTYSCDPNLLISWSTAEPSPAGQAEYCELLDLGLAPASNGRFSPTAACSGAPPNATPASPRKH